MIRGTSLAILALLAAARAGRPASVSAAPRQQTMNDATLSSLSLSDVTLVPVFDSATILYTATVAHTVEETTVTATPTNSNAIVEILSYTGSGSSFMTMVVADGIVPLNFGVNDLGVRVTSEDSTTMETYDIKVTRTRPLASRSFNPSTVAPGGRVAVTITYGDYGTLGGKPSKPCLTGSPGSSSAPPTCMTKLRRCSTTPIPRFSTSSCLEPWTASRMKSPSLIRLYRASTPFPGP